MILDPWEVRAAVIARRGIYLRNVLLRERPVVLIRSGRRPDWLRSLKLAETTFTKPRSLSSLAAYPVLRRFIGTPAERAVRLALTLAENALIYARYELISKN